jgi:phosphoribosylanthranilate isomerase
MRQSLQLKVCGMRESMNILEVASCKPDFMGFIFYTQSPRFVGIDFHISANFPVSIKRVGVFVNEQTEMILALHEKHKLDFVQLHGNEKLNQLIDLKVKGVSIIKVFSVDDNFNFDTTREFDGVVDYFLFDVNGKFYGGNAQRFNWQLLDQYRGNTPFLLSGGIKPEHIDEIKGMNHSQLIGIDVNSGVETFPGVKELSKVKSLVRNLNVQI